MRPGGAKTAAPAVWVGVILLLALLAACTPEDGRTGPPLITGIATLTPEGGHTGPPLQTNAITPTDPPLPTSTATLTPTATPTAVCTAAGEVTAHEIPSGSLPDPLQFYVYLPPCYAPDGRYPVLYLLHGQGATAEHWLSLGLAETADALIASGDLPPLIMVLPYEAESLKNPFENGFGPALTGDLIPWVDATYAACPDRACRALGGISRGAAWAVHLGFSEWALFGAIGAHSLPPFYGDPGKLPGWVGQIPAGELPALYMDIGDRDIYLAPNAEFDAALTALAVPHTRLVQPGRHDAAYWALHLPDYLRWYGQQLSGALAP